MLKATITTSSGQTVILEGDAAEIGAALSSLGGAPQAIRRGPGRPPKSSASNASPAAPAKPRKPVTAEVKRKRALQGQYMGTLRGLAIADKKKVQALAQDKGVAEALKLAKSLSAKSKK